MTRFADASPWAIASHNAGKIKEIADLVAPHGLSVKGAGQLGLAEPEETEPDFHGNARLKAQAAAAASGLVALADDSGLEVAALDGAPGVHSARWAGEPRDFGRAMARIEQALSERGAGDRSARFVCVLALSAPDGETRFYEGEVRGQLVWPPRGKTGFGYDPMFAPEGEARTFAEMTAAQKRALSHRARAFDQLVKDIFGS